ncbi:MAG: peptidase A8 [Dictyoglomus sp. NZ13-RE01]|nr:MAG: peptidase A8 [Dictyoglomus sp. NZ13-RE01]
MSKVSRLWGNCTTLLSMKRILLLVILFSLDRLVKEVMERVLIYHKPYHINSFISIRLTHNYGAALGFELPRWILIALSIIAIIAIILYIIKERVFSVSISFLLAGILGNLCDRILYGYVIDFISIGNFPIFNLADSYISIGFLMIVLSILKK